MHRCSVACSIVAPIDDAVAVAGGTKPMLMLHVLCSPCVLLRLLLLPLRHDRLQPTIAANVAIEVWSENVRNCAGTPSLQMPYPIRTNKLFFFQLFVFLLLLFVLLWPALLALIMLTYI